ncbi:MAG: hypothetical protein ACM3ZF_04740 [Mycobacterium leprae]
MNFPAGHEPDSHRTGIDAAALLLVGVAAAAAFIETPGNWDFFTLIFGLILLLVTVGYHHPVRLDRTLRSVLLRLGFGAITALAVMLVLAWPLQLLIEPYVHSRSADLTTNILMIAWFVVAAALAYFEPRIVRLLDEPRQRHR